MEDITKEELPINPNDELKSKSNFHETNSSTSISLNDTAEGTENVGLEENAITEENNNNEAEKKRKKEKLDYSLKKDSVALVKNNLDLAFVYENGFRFKELMLFKTSGIRVLDQNHLLIESKDLANAKPYVLEDGQSIMGYQYSNGMMITRLPRNNYLQQVNSVFLLGSFVDIAMVRKGFSDGFAYFPFHFFANKATKKTFFEHKIPKFNAEIVLQVEKATGLVFSTKEFTSEQQFSPIELLDYCFAILNSNTYKTRYEVFLRLDFPRIPLPKNKEQFKLLALLGSELRLTHLLDIELNEADFPSLVGGNVGYIITSIPRYLPRPRNKDNGYLQGDVLLSETCYFENVPLHAWKFSIAGYLPLQKFIREKVGQVITTEMIYQFKSLVATILECYRLIDRIDEVPFLD